MRSLMVIFLTLLGSLTVSGQSICVGGLLDVERVERLVRQEIPAAQLKTLLENCGVAFEPDDATDQRLREAGATDDVLQPIWKAAGKTRPTSKGSTESPNANRSPALQPRTVRLRPQEQNDGTTAPRLLRKVEPNYSREALQSKISGVVVLWVEVWPDGKAHNVRVVKSLGQGLDERAIEAVRGWEWDPGLQNGTPVKVTTEVELNFRLL